jgi:hypothetical protein
MYLSILEIFSCLKKYLKAKEEIMETQIFHHAKNINLQKNPLNETQILQDNVITL